jgi:hypothetical protein
LAWPPRRGHKLDTRKELVKYDSGYALILQPLLASASSPCKSVCRLGPQPALFRTCGPVLTDTTRCQYPDSKVCDVAMSPLLCTPLSRSGRFLVKCVEKPTDSTN